MKLALLEDDQLLAGNIVDYLTLQGVTVTSFESAQAFLDSNIAGFDALVLDIRLPDVNGLEILEYLRRLGLKLPVLVITAYADIDTMRRAFELGCVDFMAKPFRLEELYVRLSTRMQLLFPETQIVFGNGMVYNKIKGGLWRSDEPVALSPIQRKLLELLVREYPHVVTYETIAHVIWGERYVSSNTIASHIRDLKKIVGRDAIKNHSGQGYRLDRRRGEKLIRSMTSNATQQPE